MIQRTVLVSHTKSYPEAMLLYPGDKVIILKKDSAFPGWLWCQDQKTISAWVPECYLQVEGKVGFAERTYNSLELTVTTGELVLCGEEAAGWVWCSTGQGDCGWLPLEKLSP